MRVQSLQVSNKPNDPSKRLPWEEEALLIQGQLNELQREQAEEKKRDKDYKDRQLRFTKWLTIATIGLLIIGVIGTAISWYQSTTARITADVARRTLESSSQSFKLEQRAYLWVSSFNMSNPPICQVPGGTRICADVHVVNSGRTPANGVLIHRYATFGAMAEQTIKAMKIPAYTSSGDMLGSVGDKWGTAATDVVDGKTARDILDGKISIYVYGVVQYLDIFGDYHETGFCNFRLPNNGPFMTCEGYGNWFDNRPGANSP
jgi:hypothetical protein